MASYGRLDKVHIKVKREKNKEKGNEYKEWETRRLRQSQLRKNKGYSLFCFVVVVFRVAPRLLLVSMPNHNNYHTP